MKMEPCNGGLTKAMGLSAEIAMTAAVSAQKYVAQTTALTVGTVKSNFDKGTLQDQINQQASQVAKFIQKDLLDGTLLNICLIEQSKLTALMDQVLHLY